MTARQNDPETIREEGVNVLLAQLLRDRGVSARAERRSREGAPDVRIELGSGDSVILECKWEGSAGLLESQLEERLKDFPEALGMVGVLYPCGLRYEENTYAGLETATDLQWWLHGSRGTATLEPRLRRGSVAELADHLRTLPLELEGVDRVAAAASAVGYALEQAAKQLNKHARISRRIADVIASTDQEKDRAAAPRIGCLVLFNALAFQDRLAAANEDVPTVNETLGQGITGLRQAWRQICDNIDYVPVFELAVNILDVLGDGPNEVHNPVIDPLVKAMEDTRWLEGHDLSGRLFHTLLTDAKFTGAYYTSVPAATLLSRLVFQDWPPHVDWRDHEFPASLNVADLACGTGTLLMAVATEVERRHTAAGGGNAAELHKAMVEQALHGYDVQLSAVHFAATSLAMLNPDIRDKSPILAARGLLLIRTILVTIAIGITVLLIGGCGVSASPTATQPPTATSTTTARSTIPWTPLPISPTPMSLGVSRQEVYQALLNLNIGFLPLNKHTNEWHSTMLPNGDITIEIFGPANRVEAVELWFRGSAPTHAVLRSTETLIETVIPKQQEQGTEWFLNAMELMGEQGTEKLQARLGDMYLTLQLVPSLKSVFFSIDSEQQ